MENIENKIECSNCGSLKPIKNICQSWVEYDFDYNKQEWSENPVMINEPVDNYHYCKKCYKKWKNGDLF